MKGLLAVLLLGVLSICWAKDSVIIDGCNLEPDPGFCYLYVQKFFHNSSSKACETFVYGGCGGNANSFESKNACERSCRHPPIGEEYDENDDEETEETSKPSPPSLFGKLFQKSLLTTFDMFKPGPMSDLFDVDQPNAPDSYEDDDEDDDDDVEGEKEKDDARNPFSNILDFMRPKIKPEFDPFSKRLTGGLFGNVLSKTMNRFRENMDRSLETMSKRFGNIGVPPETVQCEICKKAVTLIEYQLKIIKISVEALLKQVERICAFFPPGAKKCDAVIARIKTVIKYLDQGQSPEDVCKNLQLCKNSTLPEGMTQTVSVTFGRRCAPLCNFMKAGYGEKSTFVARSLNETKTKLKRFCDDKKIIKKCDVFFRMLEKSFGSLSTITTTQDAEHCRCFKRQPLFDTKKFDPCLRCKQFEKGMLNEVRYVNESISLLASRVKELCGLFPSQACTGIVSELRNSLAYNTINMPNICGVTGYCENTKKKVSLFDRLKGPINMLRGIFPDPKPMVMRGMGLGLKKFSPDCLFCKKCMGDLKETFKNANETELDTKNIYPAVKEGFSLYCRTTTVGGNYTTVCKKISDDMEAVHKVITKRDNNEEGMCKTLGVC